MTLPHRMRCMLLVAGLGATVSAQGDRTAEIEAAVEAGVAWLVAHQSPDGRFDADDFKRRNAAEECDGKGNPVDDGGVTGLAIMAMLRAEHPPWSALERAVAWLVGEQRNGVYVADTMHDFAIRHAVATLALLECHRAPGGEALRTSLQRALAYVEFHRKPGGAWRYEPRSPDSDTHITGWMCQVIGLARADGFAVTEKAFTDATSFLDSVMNPETGHHGYTERDQPSARLPGDFEDRFPPNLGEAMTAMALLSREALGADPESELLQRMAELVASKPPSDRPEALDFLYWQQATRALRALGGMRWRVWSRRVADVALALRRTDGCATGSWDPVDAWGSEGGRIYSTSMMILCLADALGRSVPTKGEGLSEHFRARSAIDDIGSRDEDLVSAALDFLSEHPEVVAGYPATMATAVGAADPKFWVRIRDVLRKAYPDIEKDVKRILDLQLARAASPDPFTRMRVARWLGEKPWPVLQMGDEELVALDDPDPDRRVAKLVEMETDREPNALVAIFAAMLGDPDGAVSQHARARWLPATTVYDQTLSRSLAQISHTENGPQVIKGLDPRAGRIGWPVMLGLFCSPDYGLREAAFEANARIDVLSTRSLVTAIEAMDPPGVEGADRWVNRLNVLARAVRDDAALVELAALHCIALQADEPDVRLRAIGGLTAVGDHVLACQSSILRARLDSDPRVRAMAEDIAARFGLDLGDGRALVFHLAKLWDDGEETAGHAALALAALVRSGIAVAVIESRCPDLSADTEALLGDLDELERSCLRAIESGDASTAFVAILACGAMPEMSATVRSAVVAALSSPDLRGNAAAIALRVAGGTAIEDLLSTLRSRLADPALCEAALDVLAKLGRDGVGLFDEVAALASSDAEALRRAVVPVFMAWVPAIESIDDTDLDRIAALTAKLGSKRQPDRAAAARAIAVLGPAARPIVPALRRALGDENAAVRRRVAEALGAIGPGAGAALAGLVELLRDTDRKVAKAARDAIEAIVAR